MSTPDKNTLIVLLARSLRDKCSGPVLVKKASSRWQKRQSKVLEKARVRMSIQKGLDKDEYWTGLWGKPKDYQNTEEEAERSKRAAAAARRWREYSRKGDDRPPTFKLPVV